MQTAPILPSQIHTFSTTAPVVTIVCGVHGEEVFGQVVFDYFLSHHSQYPGIKLIFAHPSAAAQGIRFFETDLNRSFPGNHNSGIEAHLAHQLLPEIINGSYLLDIHTTVSDVKMVPIITSLNPVTKKVINLCHSEEVAYIQEPLSSKSLIGQTEHGVSLEYNVDYAKTQQALADVHRIVESLLTKTMLPAQPRKLFYITGSIPKSVVLPRTVKNFQKIRSLGVYPFLYHPRSYPEIHAMSATQVRRLKI